MGKYRETSMGAIFQNQVLKYGDRACVTCKTGGIYADISWNRINEMVHGIGWYLMSAGIKRGDKVAVFSENRHEWWVCDMAILSIGAVTVPIYATNSAEEARYILHNSESKAVFCGTRDLADKVLQVRKKLGKLKNIIMLDEPEWERPHVITFAEALKRGEGYGKKDQLEQKDLIGFIVYIISLQFYSFFTFSAVGLFSLVINFPTFKLIEQCYNAVYQDVYHIP